MTIMKTMRAVSFGLFCALIAHFGVQAATVKNDRVYKTPEEAVMALVAAVRANDETEILAILGMTKDAVASGDEIADKADRAAFLASYEAKHAIRPDGADRAILEIGEQSWPFPVPLTAKPKNGEWAFDGKAGIETIIDRRIGRNELSAEQVILAYVDAQRDYYALNPEKSIVPHFAQRIASQPGKRDGLYWETGPDQPQSPLGPLVAQAGQEGYQPVHQGEEGRPYHGYRYRILTAQGPHAEGGAYDYIQNDLMFGGFALIAYPETYGVSGVMTFIVNQDGAIYEKNLGKETFSLAQKIMRFDPDATWSLVESSSQED